MKKAAKAVIDNAIEKARAAGYHSARHSKPFLVLDIGIEDAEIEIVQFNEDAEIE